MIIFFLLAMSLGCFSHITQAQATQREEAQLIKNIILANDVAPFYQLPLPEKEKPIIDDIFTTMADKNIFQLAMMKSRMEKKGKKVEHIHPLRFFGYILSHPKLKHSLRKIKGDSFKWHAVIGGFSKRMKEEYAKRNLFMHIPGFCQQIGANPYDAAHFIQRHDWEGLLRECL